MKYSTKGRNTAKIVIFTLIILMAGCARDIIKAPPPGTGIKVVRPPIKGTPLLGRLYINEKDSYVKAGLSKEEVIKLVKNEISDKLKSIISFVPEPSEFAEYPSLIIRIDELLVEEEKKGLDFVRTGQVHMGFSLYYAEIEMKFEYYSLEKSYIAKEWRKDELFGDKEIMCKLVVEATREWIFDHVPHVVELYRYVKLSGHKIVKDTAMMVDKGNCKGAYNYLLTVYPELKNFEEPIYEHKPLEHIPYQVFYNAGVAFECMAWKTSTTFDELLMHLEKARIFYIEASTKAPGDTDVQEAVGELTYTIEIMRKYAEFLEELLKVSYKI